VRGQRLETANNLAMMVDPTGVSRELSEAWFAQ
jgi:hypothetical protein